MGVSNKRADHKTQRLKRLVLGPHCRAAADGRALAATEVARRNASSHSREVYIGRTCGAWRALDKRARCYYTCSLVTSKQASTPRQGDIYVYVGGRARRAAPGGRLPTCGGHEGFRVLSGRFQGRRGSLSVDCARLISAALTRYWVASF